MNHCPTCTCMPKLTTVKTVHTGHRSLPASELYCTATDCERDAVKAVLLDGVFDGCAYCRRLGHRAEVLADANPSVSDPERNP